MQAIRQAIDVALEDPDLTLGEARVLMAVLRDVATWSRLQDRVTRARLVEVSHASESTVKRALARLSALGAIVYEPTRGRGRASLVGLGNGSPRRPVSEPVEEPVEVVKRVTQDRKTGHPDDPLPREVPERENPPQPPQTIDPPSPEEDGGEAEAAEVLDEELTAGALISSGCEQLGWSIEAVEHWSPFARRQMVGHVMDALRRGWSDEEALKKLTRRLPPEGVDDPERFMLARCQKLARLEPPGNEARRVLAAREEQARRRRECTAGCEEGWLEIEVGPEAGRMQRCACSTEEALAW